MADDDKHIITAEQAIDCLADGALVHNFVQAGFALVGCGHRDRPDAPLLVAGGYLSAEATRDGAEARSAQQAPGANGRPRTPYSAPAVPKMILFWRAIGMIVKVSA